MYNDTKNFIHAMDTDMSEKYNFAPENKRKIEIVHHHSKMS